MNFAAFVDGDILETFLNAYLAAKGAQPVNFDRFRTLPVSQASGAQQIGRLTNLPACSIIRPTAPRGVAMGAVRALTEDGLFIGQSPEFFEFLRDLAEKADEAKRAL